MKRTYAYIISVLILNVFSVIRIQAQDTLEIPLKIKVGIEVSGPALYFSNKNILNTEAFIMADLNEKRSFFFSAGYVNYKDSQYDYKYLNNGIFARTGIDFNLLSPDKAQGKYWVGLGLHYGLARFTDQVPSFQQLDTYWGTITSSLPKRTNWGHFLEATPGVRAEIFNHFSLGWTISLRYLLYTGTGNNLKPLYIPGFGNGSKRFSQGISYFMVWNIPYKKIRVIMKKEVPEETEEPEQTGTVKQSNAIRQ